MDDNTSENTGQNLLKQKLLEAFKDLSNWNMYVMQGIHCYAYKSMTIFVQDSKGHISGSLRFMEPEVLKFIIEFSDYTVDNSLDKSQQDILKILNGLENQSQLALQHKDFP